MNKNRDDFDGFTVQSAIFLDEDGDYLAHLVETALMFQRFRTDTR